MELLDILVGQSEEDESNDGQHRDDEGGPVGPRQVGEGYYPGLRGRGEEEREGREGGREGGRKRRGEGGREMREEGREGGEGGKEGGEGKGEER